MLLAGKGGDKGAGHSLVANVYNFSVTQCQCQCQHGQIFYDTFFFCKMVPWARKQSAASSSSKAGLRDCRRNILDLES